MWSHLRYLDAVTVTITTTTGREITGPISFDDDRPGVVTISPDDHAWTDIALAHIVTVESNE